VDGSDDEDDMCVMLLIPEKTYMSEMYALHASKNQTKDKIKFLKRSFLFNSWSMDELVKLAYALKKKEFSRGENLAKQGDRSESVYLIIKGKGEVKGGGKKRVGMLLNDGWANSFCSSPRSW